METEVTTPDSGVTTEQAFYDVLEAEENGPESNELSEEAAPEEELNAESNEEGTSEGEDDSEELEVSEESTDELPEEDVQQNELKEWQSDVQESLADDPGLLDSLTFNVKIGGEEKSMTLAELKKSTMLEGDYTKKTQEFSEQRKSFEAAVQQKHAEVQQNLGNLNQLNTMLYNQLTSEFNNVNWQELRINDPAEYSALQSDFAARDQQIKQTTQQLNNQAMQAKQRRVQELKQAGMKALFEARPEWKDEAVFTEKTNAIREAAIEHLGYTEAEINNNLDPRLVLALEYSMEYLNGKTAEKESKKEIKAKKLKKLPKFVKSGTRARKSSKTAKRDKTLRRMAKLQTTDAAADAFYDLGL